MTEDELVDKMCKEYPHIFKNKTAFYTYVRGGLRRSVWNRHPVKIEFIKQNRKRIKNPNPRGKTDSVFGATCALCNNDYPLSNIEVDHISGDVSLLCFDDLSNFLFHLSVVTSDDLQLVCKPCHKIKSYADKQQIGFSEAKIIKQAIEIEKGDWRKWLSDRGVTNVSVNEVKTTNKRDVIISVLKGLT